MACLLTCLGVAEFKGIEMGIIVLLWQLQCTPFPGSIASVSLDNTNLTQVAVTGSLQKKSSLCLRHLHMCALCRLLLQPRTQWPSRTPVVFIGDLFSRSETGTTDVQYVISF